MGKRGVRPTVDSPDEVAEFARMFTDPKVKIIKIAWHFGITKKTVYYTAVRLGIPSRTESYKSKKKESESGQAGHA